MRNENCRFVRGSLARIAMFYDEPKGVRRHAGGAGEAATYDHRIGRSREEIWAVMEAVVGSGD